MHHLEQLAWHVLFDGAGFSLLWSECMGTSNCEWHLLLLAENGSLLVALLLQLQLLQVLCMWLNDLAASHGTPMSCCTGKTWTSPQKLAPSQWCAVALMLQPSCCCVMELANCPWALWIACCRQAAAGSSSSKPDVDMYASSQKQAVVQPLNINRLLVCCCVEAAAEDAVVSWS